jgi:hypothetical protein
MVGAATYGPTNTHYHRIRGASHHVGRTMVADRHVRGRQAAGGTTIWQPNSRTSSEGRKAYPAAPLVLPL